MKVSRRARLTAGALLAGGSLAYAAVTLHSRAQRVELPPEERLLGRWHRRPLPPGTAAGDASGSTDPDELARLLSLPYAAGSRPAATGATGVLRHDPARAFPGANLYVSGHGPEALLVDMDGRPLNRWRFPFERAFPGKPTSPDTAYWRRAWPLADGGILAIFQGGGMIRLDRRSRLLWAYDAGFYNDLFVDPSGRIHGIHKRARVVPEIHPDAPVLEDSILVLDGDGRRLAELSLLEAFRRSEYASLLDPMRESGDVFHTNTIEVLDGREEGSSPRFAAGNYLVSLREVDIVAIVDPRAQAVAWAQRGPWRLQHDPHLLAGGRLLLFDNQGLAVAGRAPRTRVVELDVDGEMAWQYTGPEARPLDSPQAGAVQRLPNGNTLVTDSEQGRALEVTPSGEVVWEFASPHRAGPHREFVATLFEVRRIEAPGTG